MAMNYKEISKRIAQETPEYASGAKIILDTVEALQKQGLLPERLKETAPIKNPPIIECEKEIKKFFPEAHQFLAKEGYLIYPLTGRSIRLLMKEGRKFDLPVFYEGVADPKKQISRSSEVAIKPEKLFLPETKDKSIAEQFIMTEEFSRELRKKVKGIRAIVGEVADYAELTFRHSDQTGSNLFGLNYSFNSTPTTSRAYLDPVCSDDKDEFFCIGNFQEARGLGIFTANQTDKRVNIKVAPLLVPDVIPGK